jgi:threonine dehydrogenase-like Zn-dependent dehydrogenase
MQQLQFIEPGRIEWREVAEPTLTPKGALVRPLAVATCDIDALIARGKIPVPGPFALGHEFVAEVVQVGDDVATVRPGAPYLTSATERVLVYGIGSIGLYAVASARALGAPVTYVDRSDANCVVAEQLGADVRNEPPARRYEPHQIVVHTSSTEAGLRSALDSTAPDGVLTDTGIFFSDVAMPLLAMYTKGITFVTGRVNARAEMNAALEQIVSGTFDPSPVVLSTASWDEAPEAWATHRGRLVVARQLP